MSYIATMITSSVLVPLSVSPYITYTVQHCLFWNYHHTSRQLHVGMMFHSIWYLSQTRGKLTHQRSDNTLRRSNMDDYALYLKICAAYMCLCQVLSQFPCS